LENPPSLSQIQSQARKEIKNRFWYWKPFITGLALLSETTINQADPFDLIVIDEVMKYREEYLENQIIKAELVERKR